jgi:hypothetical protein
VDEVEAMLAAEECHTPTASGFPPAPGGHLGQPRRISGARKSIVLGSFAGWSLSR